jgi:hypothetical protein
MISWRVLDHIGPAVTITGCDEGRGEIVAQQRDVGPVRPVGHAERAARSFTGIAQRLHIRWIDVSKIYRVLTGHPGHGPRETRRIVRLERAGVGGK